MTTKEYNTAVENYAQDLYRFAYKTLMNQHDAEDVVQLAFETLWKDIDIVESIKVRSYLFTIVYRRCMDIFRMKKNKVFVEVEQVERLAAGNSNYEWKEYLQKALDTLDGQTKTLILLKDIEGYKYNEIAELTGLSLEQVKVYLHRGRKQLKNFLSIKKQNA